MPLAQPTFITNNGQSYATNRPTVILRGTCDTNSTSVLINGSTTGVTYTPGEGQWVAGPYDLDDGPNSFQVTSSDGFTTSPANSIVVNLLVNAAIALIIEPPSGLKIERGRDKIRLSWVAEVDQDVRSYQVYYSREPGGGVSGYKEAHLIPITESVSIFEETSFISEQVSALDGVRTTVKKEVVRQMQQFNLVFEEEPDGTPLDKNPYYFVIATVAYDPVRRREVESPYSSELFASLLDFTPKVNVFDNRTFGDIVADMLQKIYVRQKQLDTKPLTFSRDVVVDPTSDEYNRLYAVLSFVHAAQSLLTLVQFDDPNGDGISDSFDPDLPKTKFRDALLVDNLTAQSIIDTAFESLATNYTAQGRLPARFARGKVTFYYDGTTLGAVSIPSGTLVSTTENTELGVQAVEFETVKALDVPASNVNSFYNAERRRFEFVVPIQARVAGSSGNVPPNSIRNSAGAPLGFRVNNDTRTDFGFDEETNNELAIRALTGVAGVDSGTIYGYFRKAVEVPGVRRVRIVDASHPLMFRDYDEVRKKHVGGAVDIYVQGTYLTEVTFEFAFEYPRIESEQCTVLDLSQLRFRIDNSDVTLLQPAFEIVSVRNSTKLLNFDVTGHFIQNGNIFALDSAIPLNAINLTLSAPTDIYVVTYRYFKSNRAVLAQQPILKIVDVQGSISGDLNDNYNLYRRDDPLLYGFSIESQDAIEIFPAGGKPSTAFVTQVDELILPALEEVSLSKKGVVGGSLVVTNQDGTITYVSGVDYTIVPGDSFNAPKIKRTSTVSLIPDGGSVKITYLVGENVTVRYLTNSLLQSVDARINGTENADYKDSTRHAAADALVKSVLETPVDIRVRVDIQPGFTQSDVRDEALANLTKLINNLQLGQSLNQDQVINAIRLSPGVRRVEVPLLKMARRDEALVVREKISTGTTFQVAQLGVVTAYQTVNPVLQHPTLDGGGRELIIGSGPGIEFGPIGGVEDAFYQLEPVDSILEVTQAPGRIFIGSDGRITISPSQGGDPSTHTYEVTYRVFGEQGPFDLQADDLEVLRPGEISIEITS